MGHARIPRAARAVARDHGIFADGSGRLDVILWRHVVRGDVTPTFWVEWTSPVFRYTKQYSGARGEQRVTKDWAELEEVLRESREDASKPKGKGKRTR